ncbi:MAG: ABC transporter permease [Zetaproteobacteria bacterium]|nr:MAG: ABC transporter permease [Zetaproteobacteria bacterium]
MTNRHYWSLVWFKAVADLRAEAARSYLGALWWILEPVLYLAAFYIVFKSMRQSADDVVSFLLCGLVVWKWFASTVMQGGNSIIRSAALMRQVYIPKYVFPLSTILANAFKFLFVFTLLILFLLLMGYSPSAIWCWLPALLIVQFLLVSAVALLLSALIPFIPDISDLLGNVILLLFFLSGVIFDISKAPEAIQAYLYLNPMAILVEDFRIVLVQGIAPEPVPLVAIALGSVFTLGVGSWLLLRYDRIYPKRILR